MLTTVGLFDFIVCEDLHEEKFIEIALVEARSHMASHYTRESVTALQYMILEVC